jgi:hypothetical protein
MSTRPRLRISSEQQTQSQFSKPHVSLGGGVRASVRTPTYRILPNGHPINNRKAESIGDSAKFNDCQDSDGIYKALKVRNQLDMALTVDPFWQA